MAGSIRRRDQGEGGKGLMVIESPLDGEANLSRGINPHVHMLPLLIHTPIGLTPTHISQQIHLASTH